MFQLYKGRTTGAAAEVDRELCESEREKKEVL